LDVRSLRETRMCLEQRADPGDVVWVADHDRVWIADRDRCDLDTGHDLARPDLERPELLLDLPVRTQMSLDLAGADANAQVSCSGALGKPCSGDPCAVAGHLGL